MKSHSPCDYSKVFLSVRVLPIARVAVEDRYVVSKVRTVEGFYGVTYHLGFRDEFDVKVGSTSVLRRYITDVFDQQG